MIRFFLPVKKIINFVFDIIFPPLCLNCRRYLENSEQLNFLCQKCHQSITVNSLIFHHKNFILAAAVNYENKPIQKLIHYFKYEGFIKIAEPLTKFIIIHLQKSNIIKEIDDSFLIVPIPLHFIRQRERGFNQSEELAKILGKELGLKIENKILKRIKATEKQINLKNNKQRKENVKNAFKIEKTSNCFSVMNYFSDKNHFLTVKEKLKGKSVILIDDVFTSGATINEAVRILKQNGVKKIIVAVAAKT